jgi:hypothetical protein
MVSTGTNGLGAGAQDIVGALYERRRLEEEEEAVDFERKQIEAQIELERERIEAAKATGTFVQPLPAVQLPEIKPVSTSALAIGGAVAAGLLGLIAFSLAKKKKVGNK